MIINHNISALNAWRGLSQTNSALAKSLEKLSSGMRINRAADDAAGLAISEKMRGQINGLNQAVRNAQDGISLIQTAEGALNETHSILQRMRQLAVQAANDTATSADRARIQEEVDQLVAEIGRIADTTEFNTQKLLNGSFASKIFHIGANASQNMTITISNMGASALGLITSAGNISVSTQSAADAAITKIQSAIDRVSAQRSELGAIQNRLEHTIANLGVAAENLSAAESRIRDVDMAQEMMNFTRNQILVQAGTAMLAQANMAPQAVLKLLG
ncbi:MAG: flagellin [Bacillota bacterium]